jgi:2-polyprenyl-3-methyl-5-hydroxy-6-metoxy-1,4-benzoquinol methylase
MRTLDYANGEYRAIVNQKAGVASSVLAGQERRAKEVMESLAPRLTAVHRHMDVGSGAGILIRVAKSKYGCVGVGVELDKDYIAYASEQGIVSGPAFPEGTFDLVTIVHTLEHVPRPVETLMLIKEHLDGHLYIEVPTDKYDIVHPFMFNEKSLGRAFELAGLGVPELWIDPAKDLCAWL